MNKDGNGMGNENVAILYMESSFVIFYFTSYTLHMTISA